MKCLLLPMLSLLLAACSQEVPTEAAAPAPVASASPAAVAPALAATPVAAPATAKLDSKGFSITVVEPDCSNGPVATAIANWDASSLKVAGVAIYVESPGNERKLWMEGGATGQASTGKWVFEKSRFTLQDKASGEVLATHVVDAITCP